ncbi:MAG: alpha/beta hydrolase [Anaerolineales bacterium]
MTEKDVHQGQPVRMLGTPAKEASLNVILLHGRGATAAGMEPLAEALNQDGMRFLIPQAARDYWYPQSAFAPTEANEPDLSSSLNLVDRLVQELQEEGFSLDQIAIGGFSQGACLAAEYAARHPGRYAGLFFFSGARIGPPDSPRDYEGDFAGTPVFIGGSDVDPWVSHDLLKETAAIFEEMGAEVDMQTYPGMGHTVNQDEMDRTRAMLSEGLAAARNKR